jgi:hypothetical protein
LVEIKTEVGEIHEQLRKFEENWKLYDDWWDGRSTNPASMRQTSSMNIGYMEGIHHEKA